MPRPERQIFSTHLSGPRSPAEVERARREHAARRETISAAELERLPGQDALIQYLQRKGRGQDCTDELHCHPERYEPALMDDLYAARGAGHADGLREIREVVWAGSWRLHETHDPALAARLTDALRAGVERERAALERTHPEDAKDLDETLRELADTAAALRGRQTGEALEPTLRTIEDWYAVTLRHVQSEHGLPRVHEQTRKELETLRLIRDELYYSRLFPNWAKTRNAMMRPVIQNGS